MTIENMFESAARNKVRFPYKGLISVEDLYDLSVENLDSIYKTLNNELKKSSEESLLTTSSIDKNLVLQIEIVKHIVTTKLEEQKAKLLLKERKEKKQKIMAIMETKQNMDLQNKSIEELSKMLDELT